MTIECPDCRKAGLRLPIKALFFRRASFTCAECGRRTSSELGGIVDLKNFIIGCIGPALITVSFIFLWGWWFLLSLIILSVFASDMWIMATLHRRNLRKMTLDKVQAREGRRFT